MKHTYAIKILCNEISTQIQHLKFYRDGKNGPGVDLTDDFRKAETARRAAILADLRAAVKVLHNDR